MNAEIITIGDELLLGQVVDTNSAWLGLKLADFGVWVSRRTAVGDRADAIIKAVDEAVSRVPLVILTGGLGPTRDDITKKTLCQYFSCGMRFDAEVMAHLEKIFASRGRKLLDVNRDQAMLPEACDTLFNDFGTAPGMRFKTPNGYLISLPGVPSEMKNISGTRVFPWLSSVFTTKPIVHHTLLTSGIPESLLAENLKSFEDDLPEYIKLAYLPAFNSIRLRLTGQSENREKLESEISSLVEKLKLLIGDTLVFDGDMSMPEAVAGMLLKSGKSISLAESCTGGYITNQLIQQPGISAVMKGAIVSYSNEIKHQELGVPKEIFTTVGAVSEECAVAMAEGIRIKFDTDLAISATGIAGPGGATSEKPVGLIYIGISTREKTFARKFILKGDRQVFMMRACSAALDLIRREI